jgi:ATP-dependent helicase/nuclease subunit A
VTARDAATRLRAQTEFEGPLLVEAGAGTGKTAVLVTRVVAWCLGPGWERTAPHEKRPVQRASAVLRRVVAITFTEAATAEMAERIAQAFEDVREGRLPIGAAADALPPPAVRRERAAAFRLALDQLRVNTIHAFCLRLLLAHPLEAGVHPRLGVDADGQAAAAAAREVLEEHLPRAYGDPEDPRYARLADMRIGPRELERALVTLVTEGATPDDLDFARREAARVSGYADRLADALRRWCDVEAGRLAGQRKAKLVASVSTALHRAAEHIEAGAPDGTRTLAELAIHLREIPDWERAPERLRKWARESFGAAEGDQLGPDAPAFARASGALLPFVEHLIDFDGDGWEAARSVLHELLEEVHARLRRRGFATFGGLLRGARDLLRNPDVRARVRSELDQLLVDEFQDTDALQCEILKALALDPGPGPAPTLFLVGDPKQSIYGWRNADLRAYEAIRAPLASQGRVDPLVVNFRSVPAILAEVERIVAPVMRETPGVQPAFERLEASAENARRTGYEEGGRRSVEHWLPAWRDATTGDLVTRARREELVAREARAVAADVADLAENGVDLDRVAILLRATGDFEAVLGALRDRGLAYVVEREAEFYQRREIRDAVALVRCVLDPHDALALVAALRSSVAGVPDAAWLPLWRLRFPELVARIDGFDPGALEDALGALREAAATLPPDVPEVACVSDWRVAAKAFLEALHELRGVFEEGTSDVFVERLRTGLALEATEGARYLGTHRVANLDRFFRDLVEALDEAAGSAASLVAFLRRAGSQPREHQEGRPRAPQGRAVHVLSIHRAKGLDWDHVYLIGTDRGAGRGEPYATRVERRGPDVGLVLLDFEEPGLPALAAERALVDAAERVRLLYVATTRARHRLVIGARDAAPAHWTHAPTQAALLSHRSPPAGWPEAATASAAGLQDDEHGVRWRLVDPEPGGPGGASRERAEPLDLAQLARDHETLTALRERATLRARRRFAATASAETQARDERTRQATGEEEALPPFSQPGGDGAPRSVARAAGTALHMLLERGASAGGDVDAALARAVDRAAAPGERDAVFAHARGLWERFSSGPLAARLAALGPHVIARELPVWALAAGEREEDPVGFVAGAIDLLYRDPETGQLVVADYKTDAGDPDDHVERYRAQGAVYARAVERALALPEPPRFELWFLAAGVVRTLAPGA